MPTPPIRVEWPDAALDGLAAAVERLADQATAADKAAPLNDEALFALAGHGQPAAHVAVWEAAGTLAGYGQLGPGASAQVVVAPESRRRGVGLALVQAIWEAEPAAEFWAFGNLPAAQGLARRLGARPVRELLCLERALGTGPALATGAIPPLPAAETPPGAVLRAFQPADLDGLVAVNARAFARHPEQGRWTRADVEVRLAADWFDPAGLLVAADEQTGSPVGFLWTKLHAADGSDASTVGSNGATAAPARGEVYVVAVDPAWAGQGVGRALLAAGLAYLAGRGLREAFLYVEGDQARAQRLYRGFGFSAVRSDIRYAAGKPAEGRRRGDGGGSSHGTAADTGASGGAVGDGREER
ncbi:MAG: mycothiol synthase [Propionibacteriaceae bacterium]|jgi:mycothiol synthase|nr:mycothiol synthase [Propionibacteriaceae bacterium]